MSRKRYVARRINSDNYPWAIIDTQGRFGDDLVAGHLNQLDAKRLEHLLSASPPADAVEEG